MARERWRSADGPADRLVFRSSEALAVDLDFLPITDSLPMWRLGGTMGETREIEAGWSCSQALEVVTGHQSHEQLGELTNVCRSRGFEVEVIIISDGIVDNGDLWRTSWPRGGCCRWRYYNYDRLHGELGWHTSARTLRRHPVHGARFRARADARPPPGLACGTDDRMNRACLMNPGNYI